MNRVITHHSENHRRGGEPVVIISQSVAQRMFPGEDPINHHVMYTDPVMKFVYISMGPRRIIGVAKDVDDEHVVPGASLTIYHPFGQIPDDNPDKEFPVFGGRLFVHTKGDPYTLVNPVISVTVNGTPVAYGANMFGGPGDLVVLQLNCTWSLLTPLIAPFFNGGAYTFSVAATMRNEGF